MLARWLLNRAARRYARKLPHKLHRDYGLHETYTEPEIRNAIASAGLNPKYSVLGYARYLSREHFEDLKVALRFGLGRDEALELFVLNEPVVLRSRRDPERPEDGLRYSDPGPGH